MKKCLVVYNICGINGYQDINYYLQSLASIRNQEMLDSEYDILVSSCKSSKHVIEILSSQKYKIVEVADTVPVNVTFNNAVLSAPFIFNNDYESFVYIDSGVRLDSSNCLDLMHQHITDKAYSMVSITCDSDENHKEWGIDPTNDSIKDAIFNMPIGKATNLHCQSFSKDLVDYYGRAIPDIFASFCTESTFSFLCAALQTRWGIIKDIIVHHETSMDGRSAGFSPEQYVLQSNLPTSNHAFGIPSVHQRLLTEEGHNLGFGYEEWRGIMLHKPDRYDENDFCTNNDLKKWIKDNLFLQKQEFDYSKLDSTVV